MEEEEAQGDLRRPGRRREEGDQNESPHVFDYMHEIKTGEGRFAAHATRSTSGEEDQRPVLFMLHGAGQSSWSWSRLGKELRQKCELLALDLHGHGETNVPWQPSSSLQATAKDIAEALNRSHGGGRSCPVVLVGHSLGGAIAVEIAQKELIHNLKAIVIIETSEGLVKDSMSRARQFLDRRPTRFGSVDEAVNWAIDSEIYKSREAAESSVPRMLVEDGDGWVWKTNLSEKLEDASKWFEGASNNFIKLKCHKLVIVCAKESLDCNLMVGSMQGLFQAEIIPGGHMIHEERPKDVAKLIINFLSRWKLLTPVQGKPTSP